MILQWTECQARQQQGVFFIPSAACADAGLTLGSSKNVIVVNASDSAEPAALLPHIESGGSILVCYESELYTSAAWRQLIITVATTRMQNPRSPAEFIVGICETSEFGAAGLHAMFAQGRSAGMVLLSGVKNLAVFRKSPAGQSCLANSHTTLHLDGLDAAAIQAISNTLRQAPCVAVGQSTVRWSRPQPGFDELK